MPEYIFVYLDKKSKKVTATRFERRTDRQAKEVVCRLCDDHYENGDWHASKEFLHLLKEQKNGKYTDIPFDENWPVTRMRCPENLQRFPDMASIFS